MKRHRVALLFLLAALALTPSATSLHASEPPASRTVGDATGDGRVDLDDLRLVEHAVETDNLASPSGLSDVAEPCDRELDGADLDLLKKALDGFELGLAVTSRCHGQEIGGPLPEPPPASPETLDEIFAAIAGAVPEFGGLYFDGDGLPTLVLTDLGAWSDAEAAVFARFSPERLGAGVMNAVKGSYGFGELYEYRRLARDLLNLPGVIGLDADEAHNRLRISVASAEAQDAVASALEDSGIPAAAALVEVTAPLDSFSTPYREHRRPMRGGIELGNGCTLGPIVERQGVRGYLTSAHCTPTFGANDETRFYQPSADDPGFAAGVETVDPSLFSSDDDSRCPSGAACRWSDSVFVATPFDSTTRKGAIQADTPATLYRKVEGEEHQPLSGEGISKSGWATGQTSGEITGTCTDLWNAAAGVLLLCQYVADMAGAEGDSGGPVFVEIEPDGARLYGMVWGGDADLGRVAFSGVSSLESELGWLDAAWGNGVPRIDFIHPAHGDSLGAGSSFEVELAVSVRDHEDGAECAGCTVDFSSTLDGPLGSAPVIGGEALHDVLLSGGYQVVSAAATDGGIGQSDDWALISTGSADPVVWVEYPDLLAQIPVGYDTMFVAGSFDPDTFSALPCNQLSWETDVATDPVYQGCTPIVRYDTLGLRDLYVIGTDACGDSGTGVARFEVVPAPLFGPPYVTILEPGSGTMVWRHGTVDLVGKAKDPEGQSPIQYEWVVKGPLVIGGEVVIATDSGPDDQPLLAFTWSPANDVYSNCGGTSVVIELRATDAAGLESSIEMPFHIAEGPC